MITKRGISLAVMGIFLVLGSVSTSRTLQPLWHFKIDDMTHFAMSANGEYIIVASSPNSEKFSPAVQITS
jgi:hypothetical protein